MIREKIDMLFTEDGEILFDDHKHDIEYAYESELEILSQTILTRLQSNDEDWGMKNKICANLSYLIGSPRTPEVYREAENLIFAALTADGLIEPDRIQIAVDGFDENVLMISLIINMDLRLQTNMLQSYNIGFSYDLRDNRCIPRVLNGIGVNDG